MEKIHYGTIKAGREPLRNLSFQDRTHGLFSDLGEIRTIFSGQVILQPLFVTDFLTARYIFLSNGS